MPSARSVASKLTNQAVGHGARGFVKPHHHYAIVGLVPKLGGGFMKKRYAVGKGRDAHEALMELLDIQARQAGHVGQARWKLIVLDLWAGKGNAHPVITEEELRHRQSLGQ